MLIVLYWSAENKIGGVIDARPLLGAMSLYSAIHKATGLTTLTIPWRYLGQFLKISLTALFQRVFQPLGPIHSLWDIYQSNYGTAMNCEAGSFVNSAVSHEWGRWLEQSLWVVPTTGRTLDGSFVNSAVTELFTKSPASQFPAIPWFDWYNSWKYVKQWIEEWCLRVIPSSSIFYCSAGNGQ